MSLIFIILYLISHSLEAYSQTMPFCNTTIDPNDLIDSLFNINHTVYANRNQLVWILKYNEITGNWSQIGDPIALKSLFDSYPRESFDSAFSVYDFVGCDYTHEKRCRYQSPDFDATDVTFVFFKQQFYIYRRISETLFKQYYSGKNTIPWEAQEQGSTSLDNLFGIQQSIDSALYTAPDGPDSPVRMVVLYSKDKAHLIDLTDTTLTRDSKTIYASPALNHKGNGGFVSPEGEMIFIVDNKLYGFDSSTDQLNDMGKTSWQYFNCDSMQIIVTATETPSTETTDETTPPPMAGEITDETTGGTTPSDLWQPNIPIVNGSDEERREIVVIDSDKEFREKALNMAIIIVFLSAIAMTLASVLVFMSFKILT